MAEVFEFVPFDEPRPEVGVVVELRVPNPDYSDDLARYHAALERNPFAANDVVEAFAPGFSQPGSGLIAADEICVECAQLTIVVGYPFSGQYAVTMAARTPDGFTRAELFRQLVRVYSAVYEGATFGPAKPRLNTRVDSPRFGTQRSLENDPAAQTAVRRDSKGFRLPVVFIAGEAIGGSRSSRTSARPGSASSCWARRCPSSR